MKKNFFFVIFLILSGIQSFAQWSNLNPKPTGNTLYSVCFPTENTGYVAGDHGTILKTDDAGATWSNQVTGISDTLFSVFFEDETTGWAVGTSGSLVKTTNGGAAWVQQTSGVTSDLYAVGFVSATTGVAAGDGGTILKTMDGGATWNLRPSGVATRITAIAFTGDSTGYAVGDGGLILKTADAGSSWVALNSGTTIQLSAVSFPAPDTGYAVGWNGTILKTINGGLTWSSHPSSGWMYAASFNNSRQGVMVGQDGMMWRTNDGAAHVSIASQYADGWLYGVCLTRGNAGYAVGAHGQIFKSTDGGITWADLRVGPVQDMISVYFATKGTGFMLSRQGIVFKTGDGGVTWTKCMNGMRYHVVKIHFRDGFNGYAAGTDSLTSYGVLLKTADGGATWIIVSNGYYAPFYDVFSVGENNVYAVYELEVWQNIWEDFMIKSTDGGATWKTLDNWPAGNAKGLHFTTPDRGYQHFSSSTRGLVVYKTTDGGDTWITDSLNTGIEINSWCFPTADTSFAVAAGGIIMKTTNGWTTWVLKNSGTTQDLYAVDFINAREGYAAGGSYWLPGPIPGGATGIILKTEDGGETWSEEVSGTPTPLLGLSFPDPNTGYVAGSKGTIMRKGSGPDGIGIRLTQDGLKIAPNPARSTLHLHLAGSTKTGRLSICSMTGAVLLAKIIPLPDASVDVSNFQAGVYLIRITADGKVGTGKMIKD